MLIIMTFNFIPSLLTKRAPASLTPKQQFLHKDQEREIFLGKLIVSSKISQFIILKVLIQNAKQSNLSVQIPRLSSIKVHKSKILKLKCKMVKYSKYSIPSDQNPGQERG